MAAVHLVGFAGLGRLVPSGVHTYMPLAEVIPFDVLVKRAIPCSVIGLSLLLVQRRWRSRQAWSPAVWARRVGPLRGLISVVVAQLAGYAMQLVYVDHVEGIADATAILAVAATLQACLVSIVVGLAGLVARLRDINRSESFLANWVPISNLLLPHASGADCRSLDLIAGAPDRAPPGYLLAI